MKAAEWKWKKIDVVKMLYLFFIYFFYLLVTN